MSPQAPSAVVLIRPHHFTPNPETSEDNHFQTVTVSDSDAEVAERAYNEVTKVAETLRSLGVRVHLFDDDRDDRPDSVFPNNWFSTHAGGSVVVYPMASRSRRRERRWDIVEQIKSEYRVQEVLDLSGLEQDGIFLEGTGAMVIDHTTRVVYACNSRRASPIALERLCTRLGYEPMAFDAVDDVGRPVYHTNVMMCIATQAVLIADELIVDDTRRREIVGRLTAPGRDLISLSSDQVNNFAGNAIELQGADGRFLCMSTTAAASLPADQRQALDRHSPVLEVDVSTIELAGGSLRCMIAGLHLEHRDNRALISDAVAS